MDGSVGKRKKIKRGGSETGTVGEGREGAGLLNFTHPSISDWKNCNSNTNVPRTELKFDKVNIEKMNLLPSLSTAPCETAVHANPTATDFTAKPKTSRLPATRARRSSCALHLSDGLRDTRRFCLFFCLFFTQLRSR